MSELKMPKTILESGNKLNEYLKERTLGVISDSLLKARAKWAEETFIHGLSLPMHSLDNQEIEKGLALSENLVLIGGLPRTGTTLLRDLIDGNPQISIMPDEDQYYEFMKVKVKDCNEEEAFSILCSNWLEKLADPMNQPPSWILTNGRPDFSMYAEFVSLSLAWWKVLRDASAEFSKNVTPFMLSYAQIKGGGKISSDLKYLATKTPGVEVFFKEIKGQLKFSKLIVMQRRMSDSFLSVKASRVTKNESNGLPLIFFYKTFKSLRQQKWLFSSSKEDIIKIQYEELVRERTTTVLDLFDWLNVKFSSVNLLQTIGGMKAQSNGSSKSKHSLSLRDKALSRLCIWLSYIG